MADRQLGTADLVTAAGHEMWGCLDKGTCDGSDADCLRGRAANWIRLKRQTALDCFRRTE